MKSFPLHQTEPAEEDHIATACLREGNVCTEQ